MKTTTSSKELVKTIIKWLTISFIVGLLSGLASTLFLVTLQWVTDYRESHTKLIWLLPVGGLIVGLFYHYFGKEVVKGNNLILEAYEHPNERIPFKMAPLIFLCTLLTHLFGGSAGREGTAVQMGSAITDQFLRIFSLNKSERRTLIIIGISAGFASVFGTPIAGALFSMELFFFKKVSYRSFILSFFTAFIAYYTVEILGVKHTYYSIPEIPNLNLINLFWLVSFGIFCGLTAMLFSKTIHFFKGIFSKHISFPPFRPFFGGIILSIIFFVTGATKFSGLGTTNIISAFQYSSNHFDFLIKLLFTCFTIGAGFKGGEVTPLFFIGATLGSSLSGFIPLPMALLAGMGFVAVFSGATHTPIACTAIGMELFGFECSIYVGLACCISYFCSGYTGIYSSQNVKGPKHYFYKKLLLTKFKNL